MDTEQAPKDPARDVFRECEPLRLAWERLNREHGASEFESCPADVFADIVREIAWVRIEDPHAEDITFRSAAEGAAKLYLACPGLHTQPLTDYVLLALIDSELYPLQRSLDPIGQSRGDFGKIFDAFFSKPSTGFFVSLWITLALRVIALVIACGFFYIGVTWAGALVIGWILWRSYVTFWESRRRLSLHGSPARALESLRWIRAEIDNGGYDAKTLARRLRHLESWGMEGIHSLVYPILALHRGYAVSLDT